MQECVLKHPQPEYIIVDGNTLIRKKRINSSGRVFTPEIDILTSIPNSSIVKGDAKFMSIAAASVLAKHIGMII
jgi:ribonuclease HII